MGKIAVKLKQFNESDVLNRDLVIQMLEYEDKLEPIYILHRKTLTHFGFTSDTNSVTTYRTILKIYYRSPTDYDTEVINASTYMRNNRCIFYTVPIIEIGDTIPNVKVNTLNNTDNYSIHQV